MTPEQILFETACNALHLEVTPDICNDIRQKGRDAITAAVAEEREACAGVAMESNPCSGMMCGCDEPSRIAAAIRARQGGQ